MKKVLAIILCLVLALSMALLAGCSEEKTDEEKPASSATESKDDDQGNNDVAPAPQNKGTCEICEDENVELTHVEYAGESANACAECKALIDTLIDMEGSLDDLEDTELDDAAVLGDWKAVDSDGVQYALTLSIDGTAEMTAAYNGKTNTIDCSWDLEGSTLTLYSEAEDDTVGVFDGASIDFSADDGPVFTR